MDLHWQHKKFFYLFRKCAIQEDGCESELPPTVVDEFCWFADANAWESLATWATSSVACLSIPRGGSTNSGCGMFSLPEIRKKTIKANYNLYYFIYYYFDSYFFLNFCPILSLFQFYLCTCTYSKFNQKAYFSINFYFMKFIL